MKALIARVVAFYESQPTGLRKAERDLGALWGSLLVATGALDHNDPDWRLLATAVVGTGGIALYRTGRALLPKLIAWAAAGAQDDHPDP